MSQERPAIQSLKLGPAEIRKVMDALNRKGNAAPPNRNRRLRIPFENPHVFVEVDDGSSTRVRYQVIARNLSTKGIAFIHGQFMHQGRSCTVEIPTLEAGPAVRIEGHVARCRLIAGRVHELGVVFNQSIDLGKFVALDVMSEMRAREEARSAGVKTAEAPQASASGSLLLLEDFESNRKLYSFWLSKLGLHVKEAASIKAAKDWLVREKFQIMMVDELLENELGSDFIKQQREAGVTSLIIAASAENTDVVRKRCMDAGADLFLPKPFERDVLQRTVLESLKNQEVGLQSDEPICSEVHDPEMRPLIEDFVKSLKKITESIGQAAKKNEMESLRQILRSLPEAANGYGFPKLGEVAQQTNKLLQTPDARPIDIRRSIDRLSNTAARCAA